MRTILLHVGTHKTGSSTLQESFAAHRAPLAEAGVAYVGPDKAYPHLYSAFLDDKAEFFYNRKCGLSDQEIDARDAAVLTDLDGEIEASSASTIVVSSEYLSKLSVPELSAMQRHFARHGEVQAVYFYRELLSWISSNSQQMAKAGRAKEPTEFENALDRVGDLPLRVWEAFGPDHSTFIRFEDAIETGICNTFLGTFGLPTLADLGLKERRSNDGLSADAVRALFLFNRLFPFDSKNRPKQLMDRLHALEGPKYQIAGFRPEQIARYADVRDEVQEKLGLRLQDPDELPVSDSLDPFSDALRAIFRKHAIRNKN